MAAIAETLFLIPNEQTKNKSLSHMELKQLYPIQYNMKSNIIPKQTFKC